MRVWGYYAVHTFINQIKKIFRKGVLAFILICFLIGMLGGGLAGTLGESMGEKSSTNQASEVGEEEADDEETVTAAEENAADDALISNWFKSQGISQNEMAALAIALIILVSFAYEIIGADSSSGKMFLAGDVNILFASPMPPQKVLMFRIMMKIGFSAVMTVWLLCYVPTFVYKFNWNAFTCGTVLIMWFLMLIDGQLLQAITYVEENSDTKKASYIEKGLYIFLALLAVLWFVAFKVTDNSVLASAGKLFSSDKIAFIPVFGWLLALFTLSLGKNLVIYFILLTLSVVTPIVLLYILNHLKADYYENAIEGVSEANAVVEKMKETGKLTFSTGKKKERKIKTEGSIFTKGSGASMFFYKTVNNHRRFAKFGFLTKSAIFYLAEVAILSVGTYAFLNKVNLVIIVFALLITVFYRALSNSLSDDAKNNLFFMAPSPVLGKVTCSVLGDMTCTMLDMLPAVIILLIEAVVTGNLTGDLILGIIMIPVMWFFSVSVGTFIETVLPENTAYFVKQLAQVLFVYFGLMPDAFIIIPAYAAGNIFVGEIIAFIFNLIIGELFLFFTSSLLEPNSL